MTQPQHSAQHATTITTYPEPQQRSVEQPHVHNIYAKPIKNRNKYGLQYDCYETGNTLFWMSFDDAVKDINVHEYFKKNHIKYPTFSAYWKRTTKLIIKAKIDDVIYDREDDEIYVIQSIAAASDRYVHPHHYNTYCFVTAEKIDRERTEDTGDVYVESPKEYLLNHQHMVKIGNINEVKIIFKIMKQYKYADSKKMCISAMKKKLRTTTNPIKRPTKINKIWTSYHFIFDRFIEIKLKAHNIAYSIKAKMVTVKMRKSEFDLVFKELNKYSLIETSGDACLGYLDYIVLKINLKLNTLRIMAIFLIYQEDSGEILGEDLVPDDW